MDSEMLLLFMFDLEKKKRFGNACHYSVYATTVERLLNYTCQRNAHCGLVLTTDETIQGTTS